MATSYQTPSLSAEIVAGNDGLLTQILLCLPIDSLLAFKSVSKHWLSLISDPHFCYRRRPPLCNPICGLFLLRSSMSASSNPVFDFVNLKQSSRPVQSKPFRLSFANDSMGIKILQSCNGLLLCSTSRGPETRKKYSVYNPTTKHYTILPDLPVLSIEFSDVLGLSLAFDPSKSPHYKVVCVRSSEPERTQLGIEIYSSEMGPWRVVSGSSLFIPIPIFNLDFNGGVYWNGAVHWITRMGASRALRFDLEDERLTEIPLPPLPEGWEDWNQNLFGYFGVCGDHLHLVGMYDSPSTLFNVYEMERDYSGWFVKFRVDVGRVLVEFSDPETFTIPVQNLWLFSFCIICVVRCEVDEQSYMVMHFPGVLVKFYLKTNSFVKLCDFDNDYWTVTFPLIESLACV